MSNTLDFTKSIQTRDGRKVRIVSTSFELEQDSRSYCVCAEVEDEGYVSFTKEGKYTNGEVSEYDLQNIPEETFEQKVERFKKSEYFVSEKSSEVWGNEIVIWTNSSGFTVVTSFYKAIESTEFQ